MRSQLVKDAETGKMCMQVILGEFSAMKELPDQLATYTQDGLKLYFESVVAEMVEGLHEMRNRKKADMRKKAQRIR